MLFFRALALLLLLPCVQAMHLSPIGPVYPIGEERAIKMIERKLQEKAQRGELQKLQQALTQRVLKSMTHLAPVKGIATVTTRAQRLIDPTVTYSKPITTPQGQVVVAKGTRVNPLEYMTLSKTYVFFDGRDPEQVKAVQRVLVRHGVKIKPILIAGSWLNLTKAWQTQVYYDQQGALSQRFKIRAVPTLIRQQGKQLVLDEVPAQELR